MHRISVSLFVLITVVFAMAFAIDFNPFSFQYGFTQPIENSTHVNHESADDDCLKDDSPAVSHGTNNTLSIKTAIVFPFQPEMRITSPLGKIWQPPETL